MRERVCVRGEQLNTYQREMEGEQSMRGRRDNLMVVVRAWLLEFLSISSEIRLIAELTGINNLKKIIRHKLVKYCTRGKRRQVT
jgi:hypothetical protein